MVVASWCVDSTIVSTMTDMKGSSPFGLNPLLDQNRKWSYLVRTWSRASSIGRKSGGTGPAEHAHGQFDHGGWNGALLLV